MTIWLLDSKQEIVISDTELDSWKAKVKIDWQTRLTFFGRNDRSICGEGEVDSREAAISPTLTTTYGTKLVWNSLRSTLRDPSNRSEAVMEETTWAISRFKLVNEGEVMPKFRRQMS